MAEVLGEQRAQLKQKIKREAGRLGANLIGFAPAARWEEYSHTAPESRPQAIWPWTRTVIVLAVQIYLPMLETTPSVVYSELYNTGNRMLDEMAYHIANKLNAWGYRAHFFPRDCYGDISVLVQKPEAAFSHVIAGYYAGLGTIGMNHTLLTEEYGPRVRLVSVLTDADIAPDPMRKEELCIRCGRCVRACPMQALARTEGSTVAEMDKHKCASWHQRLKKEYRYPCGICTAVCPVGEDKKRYGAASVSDAGVEHIQNFGSANALRG